MGSEPAGDRSTGSGVSTRHHVTSTPSVAVGVSKDWSCSTFPTSTPRDVSNRAEAERVLALVDLFVWVTDPQKYADARLHDDYVAALASHDAVMLVVLNQGGSPHPPRGRRVRRRPKRLLVRDGVRQATVLPVSANGRRPDALGQRLANTVAGAAASRTRLAADVRSAAQRLAGGVADSEPTVAAADQHELIDALARSAGVPMVVDAVARDYRMEATVTSAGPSPAGFRPFAPDLCGDCARGQDHRGARPGRAIRPGPVVHPTAQPSGKAAVALATRNLAGVAGAGLPTPWADAVDAAADPPEVPHR